MVQAVFIELDRRSTADENICFISLSATAHYWHIALHTSKTGEQNNRCVHNNMPP
jgi:hypothetical protein